MEPIDNSTRSIYRPGSFVITDKALSYCSFPSKAKLLDIGCGTGATVLHMINNYNFDAFGIDKNLKNNSAKYLIKALAEDIPFLAASKDGVIMECSFSLMDDQEKVLKECYRVLKNDGRLIISEIYARGEAAQLNGCLGFVDTKENLIYKLECNNFKIELFEDFSHHLQSMWGQMIFEKGAKSFYKELGVCYEKLKQVKCGYCLIIARKENL